MTARPAAIWSATLRGSRACGLNDALLQKVQPPLPSVPSRFGQVNPASIATLWTRSPYRRSSAWPNVWTCWARVIEMTQRPRTVSRRGPCRLLCGRATAYFAMTASTSTSARRFFARPSAVLFDATGCDSPKLLVVILEPGTPLETR